MPTIDGENAKQIREPMDVLIQMDARDSLALTYSGYSDSAKVTDDSLSRPEWSMRKIADLQGDGFPLNGTHVLYNSATAASSNNGHIGVRGHIGQPVVITVTATTTISTVSIIVSGAATVSAGGSSYNAAGGSLIIPVEDTTATLTFTPAQADKRVEVSGIVAGTFLRIGNESLIRCVVSLRSDLSIINPTLPESEINIECFNDADVSEYVAQIPEDTPITYSAGYPGNMSATRRFYVSGQVEWADNVLSVHAVDAVHLICDVDGAFSLSMLDGGDLVETTGFYEVEAMMESVLSHSGIRYDSDWEMNAYTPATTYKTTLVDRGANMRQLFADAMNFFHLPGSAKYFSDYDAKDYWLTYIDAGIPTVRYRKPDKSATINEEDCAELTKSVERTIPRIRLQNANISCPINGYDGSWRWLTPEVGRITSYKNSAAFVDFDDYVYSWTFNLLGKDISDSSATYSYPVVMMPASTSGRYHEEAPYVFHDSDDRFGTLLIGPDTPQYVNSNGYTVYTQVIPWNAYFNANDYLFSNMSGMWTFLQDCGYAGQNDESLEIRISGFALKKENVEKYYGERSIDQFEDVETALLGQVYGSTSSGGTAEEVFPSQSLRSLLARSPNTGSFTWKGDPRMQPRDVVDFVNLDGSTTVITLENITLTHEGGGLSAEITYREGIV